MLYNVPKEVTDAKIEIYSPTAPIKKGDSFIVGLPVLTVQEEEDCAICKGGITALELKYTGSVANQTIIVYKGKVDNKNKLATFTDVSPNQSIKFSGNEKNQTMGTNIIITINGIKNTEIHTSCSQDIYTGMQFGDFNIVSGTSKDGGPLCPGDNGDCGECKGGVTELLLKYTGTGAGLSVKNKNGVITAKITTILTPPNGSYKTILISNNGYKLGTEISITVDGKTTALHTSCSKPIYVGMKFGLNDVFEILSGTSKDGGLLCEKPGDNGNCECEGGVTALTLEYIGTGSVNALTVKTNKGTVIVPKVGNTFSIYDAGAKLGTNIYITVGTITTALHTSCSQPIYAGMTFGVGNVFKIVDGTSLSGGKLCDVPYIKNKSAMIENIETIAEIHEFRVYPNPVLNIVTVSFMPAYDGLATVELYNSLGQKADILFNQIVNKEVPVSFTFSGHKFKEGLYLLILQNGDYMETAKVRIAR